MRMLCENEARKASALAQEAECPETRLAWEQIANRWRQMAALFPGRCFCGRPAAGTRHHENGARSAVCGDHLLMALMQGACVEFALTDDD